MRRGQGRDTVADRSPTAHRWQTTLTPAQAAVGRARRETRWLPRDELLVVTREVINE